ncbi:amino acid transporter, putative [Talaromyces stipitatus ATCC 10500]|uniref:Amino acid transporter, putative n=1 Tax=Talaromyces stipitatus (strain ATCC 10500 / CBS 375.48 / QM 6759 / NRRL 1006) TaxID=441959 RepID=B8MPM6_TALSN|nr:amino acid transporter, putative [Talaromyces stipitatus ATCC 10500]EED14465.1 amino acid transporter, putative [Talaromyces stipitatus ATCC 10500]
MSEEIRNASRVVPGAMIFSLVVNGVLGFGILIAVLFCLGDVDAVLASPAGYPFMAVFQEGVKSLGGATTMSAIVTILVGCASISVVASASRMTWSFARDRGLPGWRWLTKLHSKSSIPVVAIALTTTISCLLSLINLSSAVAFNDVVSLTVDGLYTSYFIGNSLLLWRRATGQIKPYSENDETSRGPINVANAEYLTWGPWKIPEPFGTIINATSCVYMIVVIFFSYWPTSVDPTLSTMNFSSLMVGATGILSTLYYIFWARKVYSDPIIEIEY